MTNAGEACQSTLCTMSLREESRPNNLGPLSLGLARGQPYRSPIGLVRIRLWLQRPSSELVLILLCAALSADAEIEGAYITRAPFGFLGLFSLTCSGARRHLLSRLSNRG